jgi:SAM-dependent methyltransferase
MPAAPMPAPRPQTPSMSEITVNVAPDAAAAAPPPRPQLSSVSDAGTNAPVVAPTPSVSPPHPAPPSATDQAGGQLRPPAPSATETLPLAGSLRPPLPGVSGPPPAPSSGSMPPRPAPRRASSQHAPGATARITPVPKSLPPDLAIEPGVPARVTPPHRTPHPLPRPSEPPPPAHVIVGADQASTAQSKPTPAPAINVMRIIAIGTPGAAPAEPVVAEVVGDEGMDVDFDEDTPALARSEAEATEVRTSEAAELEEVEFAPDSQDANPTGGEAVLELEREDAKSVPPEPPPSIAKAPDLEPGEAKSPPPPPRRPGPPKLRDSARPRARRALKRPWWEDLFGEDFTRAVPRLTDKQVHREVDFIEESLGVAKGGVVLDLGCGAGHHAVDLASRGYGVVGYDLSVYQLALAADVAQERDQKINFLHGDMREMAFEAMFDGIYCWNTTFGYFEEEKNVAVAERVFRALKPGGMFLLDVANRDFAATYSPSQLWYEGDSCVCMDDMSVDFITSRLRVKRSVIFDDGRSRECTYSIRLYSLHELGKILHDVGFRVAEASGHPSTPGVFFGELSPRLIVLAQKP